MFSCEISHFNYHEKITKIFSVYCLVVHGFDFFEGICFSLTGNYVVGEREKLFYEKGGYSIRRNLGFTEYQKVFIKSIN